MAFYYGLHHIPQFQNGCALSIGNFDGVHLGHQLILQTLKKVKLPQLVMVFEPQPQEFFQPEAPARLTNLREKINYFQNLNIDNIVCIPFHEDFANLSAQDFIQKILIQTLNVKEIVIGEDFRFGHDRLGNADLLEKFRISVTKISRLPGLGEDISSSRIRKLLQAGELGEAAELLGHCYTMIGRVFYGDQRGRTIGFPTANICLSRQKSPLRGVFVVRAHWKNQIMNGVANVGIRPTIGGQRERLEVHLFDFDKEIYGEILQIEFLKKIRNEMRFANLEALKAQIQEDVLQAKQYFLNS